MAACLSALGKISCKITISVWRHTAISLIRHKIWSNNIVREETMDELDSNHDYVDGPDEATSASIAQAGHGGIAD